MKVKFEKRLCKIATGVPPFFKEVELRVFEYKGVEYGYAYKDTSDYEFTHIRSGQGFNGTKANTLNTAFDSFMTVVNDKERDLFARINEIRDIDDEIAYRKTTYDHNKRDKEVRLEIINELRKIIPIPIHFCKVFLLGGKIAIDLLELDEKLKKRYSEEYPDNMSMKEFIINKWGEDVADKIHQVL